MKKLKKISSRTSRLRVRQATRLIAAGATEKGERILYNPPARYGSVGHSSWWD